MNRIESLKMRIWFWWHNLRIDFKSKCERICYLVKRNFSSNAEIPVDEFDPSLNMNLRDMLAMNEEERDEYVLSLVRRRNLAHEADIEGLDKQKHP